MVMSDHFSHVADADGIISQDASTPLVVVVPGLTSDSDSAVSPYLFWMLVYMCSIFEELLGSWFDNVLPLSILLKM
jgi:hypothetical protein